MSTIKKIIEGASVRQTTTSMEIADVYYLDDLSPGEQMQEDALATPGVPQMGDYHPRQSTLKVQSREVEATGGQFSATVRVTYSNAQPSGGGGNSGGPQTPDDPARASVGATVQAQESEFDSSGTQIIIDGFNITNQDGASVTYAQQTQSIQVLQPQVTRRYTRIETQDPQALALAYVGHTNSNTWNAGDPYTWMCTAVNGETDDYGLTWTVTYDFQYQSQYRNGTQWGWRTLVTAIDSTTGKPAEGLELPTGGDLKGNGCRFVEAYHTIDFRNLNLA